MDERIEVGDIVEVWVDEDLHWNNMEVLYTPQATGDSWHLRDKGGDIVYVQLFQAMKKLVDLQG